MARKPTPRHLEPRLPYVLFFPAKRRGCITIEHAHAVRGTLTGLLLLVKGNSRIYLEDYTGCRIIRADGTKVGNPLKPIPLP